MPHRLTDNPMIHLDLLKFLGGLAASLTGGITVYLAQFSPKEAEGWMQLGGLAISLGGAVIAIRYLVKKLEEKDSIIVGLFKSVETRQKEYDDKREADRLRMEQKWEFIRNEDLTQRESDRVTRDKFADAVDKQADAVDNLATAVSTLKPKD